MSEAPLLGLLQDQSRSRIIKQGAEAKVYKAELPWSNPPFVTTLEDGDVQGQASSSQVASTSSVADAILLKYRFPKHYRHPTLSSNITIHRTAMEARALLRCAKSGIHVPQIKCVDERSGILGIEWIDGRSVREWLGGGAEGDEAETAQEPIDDVDEEDETLSEEEQTLLMDLIGAELAHMHSVNVIHGDLTTSNMMLRQPSRKGKEKALDLAEEINRISLQEHAKEESPLILIDFGLASVSTLAEDKAVDLYVLERAFASTHPGSEHLFRRVLETYFKEFSRRTKREKVPKGGVPHSEDVRRKLEEVRLRGRKRSMVG